MSETDAYLDKFLGEAQLDQSGLKFQVDWATQLRKLRSFQSGEPAVWIVKAVQAAVAAGAPKVSIKFTNECFEVSFDTREDLNSSLTGWAEHLRLAVELAVSQQPPGLRLVHAGQIIFSSGVSLPIKPASSTYLQLFHLPPGLRAVSSNLSIPDIHMSLSRRCCLCPIPIYLDGLQLNQGRPERSKLVGASRPDLTHYWLAERVFFAEAGQPAFILACPALRPAETTYQDSQKFPLSHNRFQRASLFQYLERAGQPETGECEPHQRESFDASALWLLEVREKSADRKGAFSYQAVAGVTARVQEKATFWEKGCATAACARWLALSGRGDSPGGLFYVNDGILLNPVPLEAAYAGTTLVVATSGISTDLSQFNPVVDDKVRAQREWGREEERKLAEISLSQLDSQAPRALRSHWQPKHG